MKNKRNGIHLTILGIPKAKQSVRFGLKKSSMGKTFIQKFKNKDVAIYERNIAFDVKSQLPRDFVPFSEALSVKAVFVFPMLKGFSKSKIQAIEQGEIFYKTTKPDLTDNLMKGTIDALNGIVFTDDSIIAKVDSIKIYGVVPKIELEFNPLNP